MEELEFDYSVGFNYDIMAKVLENNATEENISLEKHIKDSKYSYFNLSTFLLDQIAKCDDAVKIVFLIDKYNRARTAWTHYEQFEFEMKLHPSER
jgi:hypothetical protein